MRVHHGTHFPRRQYLLIYSDCPKHNYLPPIIQFEVITTVHCYGINVIFVLRALVIESNRAVQILLSSSFWLFSLKIIITKNSLLIVVAGQRSVNVNRLILNCSCKFVLTMAFSNLSMLSLISQIRNVLLININVRVHTEVIPRLTYDYLSYLVGVYLLSSDYSM